LLTATLVRQAAAAVGVKTCWPWEIAATLSSAQRRKALGRPLGRRGAGHIVSPRAQLVMLPPLTGGALSDAFVLSDVSLSVCRTRA